MIDLTNPGEEKQRRIKEYLDGKYLEKICILWRQYSKSYNRYNYFVINLKEVPSAKKRTYCYDFEVFKHPRQRTSRAEFKKSGKVFLYDREELSREEVKEILLDLENTRIFPLKDKVKVQVLAGDLFTQAELW